MTCSICEVGSVLWLRLSLNLNFAFPDFCLFVGWYSCLNGTTSAA
jgi:hypothetical protein